MSPWDARRRTSPIWRMDTLRWGTALLLAEVGQTPQKKRRPLTRHSATPPCRVCPYPPRPGHLRPKRPVIFPRKREDRSLSPDVPNENVLVIVQAFTSDAAPEQAPTSIVDYGE